jgi:hypothetical protein
VKCTPLSDYLNRRISLANLVDWAEGALCDGELDEQNFDQLRDILARVAPSHDMKREA